MRRGCIEGWCIEGCKGVSTIKLSPCLSASRGRRGVMLFPAPDPGNKITGIGNRAWHFSPPGIDRGYELEIREGPRDVARREIVGSISMRSVSATVRNAMSTFDPARCSSSMSCAKWLRECRRRRRRHGKETGRRVPPPPANEALAAPPASATAPRARAAL